MTRYHVKTKQDYQILMEKLEHEGRVWYGGEKPTEYDGWSRYKENTIIIEYGQDMIGNAHSDKFKVIEFSHGKKVSENTCYNQRKNRTLDIIEENFTREEMIAYYRMRAIEALTRYCDKDLDITTFCLDKLREIEKVEDSDG